LLDIKNVNSKKDLKKLFNFLSEVLYYDAIEYKEHYFPMSERYDEMKKQYEIDKDMLMYIEENNTIIAGITAKSMNMIDKKITLGVLGVDKNSRGKGLAKKLVFEFEKRCKEKGIGHISLGARFRACPLYEKLGYSFALMIQVFDFVKIDDIKQANKYGLEEISSYQGDTYGFVTLKVNTVEKKYVDYFESKIKTAHVQYIFEKDL
jgi:GNAT superfamily N-acetyltransferase